MSNILKGIRHLSIEVGPSCNLSREHTLCPNSSEERFPEKRFGGLTEDDIVKAINDAVKLGFEGFVGFHYYNEPLAYKKRIENIINESSYDRFMLWTNGLLLNQGNPEDTDILNLSQWVLLSNYWPEKYTGFFNEIRKHYPQVEIDVFDGSLDNRMDNYDRDPEGLSVNCWRHRIEIPIDYYGNIHLCCQDWKGSFNIGNIKEKGLYNLLCSDLFKDTTINLCTGTGAAPKICKKCYNRISEGSYVSLCQGYITPYMPKRTK